MVLTDCELLSDVEWRVLIIDEAHRLKNRGCKLLEGLRLLDVVSMKCCLVCFQRYVLYHTKQNTVNIWYNPHHFIIHSLILAQEI